MNKSKIYIYIYISKMSIYIRWKNRMVKPYWVKSHLKKSMCWVEKRHFLLSIFRRSQLQICSIQSRDLSD